MGQLSQKTFFSPQNMPHTVSFSGVLKNFSVFAEKKVKGPKSDYLEKKLRIQQREIIFQRVWKEANIEERFWFDGNDSFCSNQWNGTITTENSFSPQKEPCITKLSFSDVLEHFLQKLTKKLTKNMTILERT